MRQMRPPHLKSFLKLKALRFKGCDSKIVILLDVSDKDPRWDATGMYTALSRATSQAYILRKSDS